NQKRSDETKETKNDNQKIFVNNLSNVLLPPFIENTLSLVPADKNLGLTILNKDKYYNLMLDLLNDSSSWTEKSCYQNGIHAHFI
ncbi:12910_t:CDS:2, partial [Ambispora gerdemannii]